MKLATLFNPKRLLSISVLLLTLFAVGCETQEPLNPTMEEVQTLDGKPTTIPGKYIITLHEDNLNYRKTNDYDQAQAGMRKVAQDIVAKYGVSSTQVDRVYGSLLTGFSATLSPSQVAALRNDPNVKNVEEDGIAYKCVDVTQNGATWGIDRLDQRARPLDQTYIYGQTGEGVKVFILDTGIKYDHVDFENRAVRGFSGYNDLGGDVDGHGTHVAGTVGSKTYGVAKKATLVSVKVLSDTGSGSFSTIVAGMDWVAANKGTSPAVVNMSLGGSGTSATVNAAAKRLFDANVPVIVAAGNSNLDASGFTPANAPEAFAVGSSTSTDARSSFSNFGPTVKLFAPGSSITSTTVNGSFGALSGTSMASPHVAGAAALLLQVNPTAVTQQIYDLLGANATKGIITGATTTPNNHLLFTRGSTTVSPVAPPPPPAPITLSASWTKVSQRVRVQLTYSGFPAGSRVDIFRNGSRVATTSNLTTYEDRTNLRGSGTIVYRVCRNGGTTSCSQEVTVTYN